MMERKLRVGVIFGGRSGEHEVSLVSATSVITALDADKYEVVPIGITQEGRWLSSDKGLKLLKEKTGIEQAPECFLVPEPNRQALVAAGSGEMHSPPIDVIFPLVHGTYGEDGTLQGLLELANIPYVGAGVLASAVGMDKIVQKQIFQQQKLPVAKYIWFHSSVCREHPERVAAIVAKSLTYPVFVKPANTGSSVGISKAHNRKELREALALAVEYDRKVIIEQGINNIREIECSVLGNDEPVASVPGEIVPSNEFYDYNAKYVDGKSEAIIPAKLPKRVSEEVRRIALQAYRALDIAGMARVDFLVVRKSNKIYLNEVNTIPGFTSISMYPKLWEASGLGYRDLLDRLIELALERHRAKNELRTVYNPDRDWYKE
ncbi:MAG: D-alanine--D-alanine ligase [Bacteroidetes bacterium]|nr:D-alanine--D-alanine ligase [Bacteroidota bacterium]